MQEKRVLQGSQLSIRKRDGRFDACWTPAKREAAQPLAQAGLFWFIVSLCSVMCLAIPGKILSADESNGLRVGRVQFGGIVRSARLDFVPEARVGDYVMVHVGFAISRVDEKEAERTYALLKEMGALEAELPPEDNESA